MRFTILGASGFIGSNLVKHLERLGKEVLTPDRDDPSIYEENLGHVIYSIGLTSDFRKKPYETVRAHVCHLIDILENTNFESFLYLSSTRVYIKSTISEETTTLRINPSDPEDLYNLSKLLGESVCFASGYPTVRVARLSNVFGIDLSSNNFLTSLIKDAFEKGAIFLGTTLNSEKDYISIRDVVDMLPQISKMGRQRCYNVASGVNVTNRAIVKRIQEITNCSVEISKYAATISFPKISVKRVQDEFCFSPDLLLSSLDDLILRYRTRDGQSL